MIGSENLFCDLLYEVDLDDFLRDFIDWGLIYVYCYFQWFLDLGVLQYLVGVVDFYDVFDDWLFVYDVIDVLGYYFVIGISGNQFKNVFVVGRFMLELIFYCEVGNDYDCELF